MRISKHTDYALRVLMYLGLKEGTERSSIREISEAFDISHNHLMKVVQKLSGLGYVNGQRGKSGGITLAKHPEAINIGAVFRDFEWDKPVVDCGEGPCVFEGYCLLEIAFNEAMADFVKRLEKYHLADVLRNRPELEHVLHQLVR